MATAQAEYEAGIRSSIEYWFDIAEMSEGFGDDYDWQRVTDLPTEADIVAM